MNLEEGGQIRMIYLDNAATSWPKPETVYKAIDDCMRNYAANPGRSGHKLAMRAAREIYATRELAAELFHVQQPERIIFTSNTTESLNMAIKGLVKSGDHVILSSMEHNSVIRPLKKLEKQGVSLTILPCNREGALDLALLYAAIRPETKLIVCLHASNVTGTLLPIAQIGAVAKKKGIRFLVDAAQSAGVYDIDIPQMGVDMLAARGHKGLFGPQGTGLLYVGEGISLDTLEEGGTGSKSAEFMQPDFLPDRLESGTVNTPGIIGLQAGLQFLEKEGLAAIRSYEEELCQNMIDGLLNIPGVCVYGPQDAKKQAAVVAFMLPNMDCSKAAYLLDSEYCIACRPGLHCSPLAHNTIGTGGKGALRFSMGYFNSKSDVLYALSAVRQLVKG